jgi:uncharacterized RDD family membrane protein YckC
VSCPEHPEIEAGLSACSRCARRFCPDCLIEIDGLSYCAACKHEQLRDMRSGVDSTRWPLASLERRLAAVVLDGALLAAPLCGGVLLLPTLSAQVEGRVQLALWIGSAAVSVAYDALLLGWRGQTLGKSAMGVKVVSADGSEVRPGQAWTRAGVRLVAGTLLIGYLPALFTQQRTCLHDLLARTRVVRWRL